CALRAADRRTPPPGPARPRRRAATGPAALGGRVRGVPRRCRLSARGDRRPGVARDGPGWTGHDLLAGDRARHPRSGGGSSVIGPYALACLDMAGTTVRDDGAVEAAFDEALAAVRGTKDSPRYEEAHGFVRETMGWSKADVFARLLDPDEAARATARFAGAYEAV